jgi:hypothetical protein
MPRIQGEIVIHRPVDVVFDVVADERNAPTYNAHLLRVDPLTDPVVGPGARWSALVRTGRWPVAAVIECTEYEHASALASITTTPGMEVRRRLTFQPVPEGTRLSWDYALRPTGALRLMSPVLGAIVSRQERATWTAFTLLLESSDEPIATADGQSNIPA